jgi:pimeloyl-ACP methyl ester carboxylesterase
MANLPLILIHGAGCDKRTWPESLLNSSQIRAVPIDLPGHGDASGKGKRSIEEYVKEIVRILDEKQVSKAIFCGHSMGGAISMTLALIHPQKTAGLILVGTGARLKVAPLFMKILKTKSLFWLALRISLFTSLAKNGTSKARGVVKAMLKGSGQESLYGDLTACTNFDEMNEIDQITVPTLILCGRQDQLAPLKYSQYLNKKIKGSSLEIFEGVGHFPSLESPEAFTKKVIDWIQKNNL